MFKFLVSGLTLLNRSLEFYLFWVILIILGNIKTIISSQNSFISLIFILAVFLEIIFNFTLPKLLELKNKNEKISAAYIANLFLINAKKLIIPIIIFLILTGVVAITLVVILAVLTQSDPTNFPRDINKYQWTPQGVAFSIGSSIALSFLIFTPIIFAIEEKNVWVSISKSVAFAIKNLKFVLLMGVITGIAAIIIALISTLTKANLATMVIIGTIFNTYVRFMVLATSLLYYQKTAFDQKSS